MQIYIFFAINWIYEAIVCSTSQSFSPQDIKSIGTQSICNQTAINMQSICNIHSSLNIAPFIPPLLRIFTQQTNNHAFVTKIHNFVFPPRFFNVFFLFFSLGHNAPHCAFAQKRNRFVLRAKRSHKKHLFLCGLFLPIIKNRLKINF